MSTIQIEITDEQRQTLESLARGRKTTAEEIAKEAVVEVARVASVAAPSLREHGFFRGRVSMSDDFNAPLPPDELSEWEK